MKRLANLRPLGLVALGVFLGRGAQADTIIDFDTTPTGLGNNSIVIQSFGDHATASSDGVTVTGFGTPNIGLTWLGNGASWQYYVDSVWSGGQLDSSAVGDSHSVIFAPNSAAARVVVKSLNFHPYYVSDERYTYAVSVVAGATVVSGPTTNSFLSAAAKVPVSINHTGALGQTLELKITRVASTLSGAEFEGSTQNIAVDDIAFAQVPAALQSVGPQVVSVSPAHSDNSAPAVYSYRASITNGDTAVVAGSIHLRFDGSPVSPPPTISSAGGLTNVNWQSPGFLAPGSAHSYSLIYADNGAPAATYTNEVHFTMANYPTLPTSYAYPSASGSTRGFTFRPVTPLLGTSLPNSVARARDQLNGTLIDPLTGLPYENTATPGPNPDGSYNIDTVLDFDNDGALSGNFTNDQRQFPGLSGGENSFATEASLYLELPAGYYRFGVNSDDGFEVSAGTPPQGALSLRTVLGFFDDGRGAADTLFDFLVQSNGIYSFNMIYFEGGGSASAEFFSVDLATGQKILINDTNAAAIKSYRALTGVPLPPYVRYVQPAANATDVPLDTTIRAGIWDRATALVPSVLLTLNGAPVSPITGKTGIVTTVSYQPPAPLAPGGTNTVRLVHTDGTVSQTNTWSFITVPPFRISSAVRSGTNLVIQWTSGNPPFQVQFKDSITNLVWSDSGAPTSNRVADVPILPGAGFIRVVGQ